MMLDSAVSVPTEFCGPTPFDQPSAFMQFSKKNTLNQSSGVIAMLANIFPYLTMHNIFRENIHAIEQLLVTHILCNIYKCLFGD